MKNVHKNEGIKVVVTSNGYLATIDESIQPKDKEFVFLFFPFFQKLAAIPIDDFVIKPDFPIESFIEKFAFERYTFWLGRNRTRIDKQKLQKTLKKGEQFLKEEEKPDGFELLEATKDCLIKIVASILQIRVKAAGDFTRRFSQAIAAKMAGAGVAVGFLGLISAFGTAGTGTAIATLSGAAATSATLAWVGGLVGGGMAAGGVLTGGLAIVVGVVAYRYLGKYFKSKPREYETLEDIDQQVVDMCTILIKAIDDQLKEEQMPKLEEIKIVYRTSIAALFELIDHDKEDIESRLNFRKALSLDFALYDYVKVVMRGFFNYIQFEPEQQKK